MLDLINAEILNLKVVLENTPGAPKNGFKDEHLFGGVCVSFFYRTELGLTLSEWGESFCDGPRDNGIDWVSRNEIDDDNTLCVVQSKFQVEPPTASEVVGMIRKMQDGLKRLKGNSSDINQKAKDAYDAQLGYLSAEPQVRYIVFLSSDLSPDKRRDVSSRLEDDLNWDVYGLSDIHAQILARKDGNPFVESGRIEIFKEHGKITVGDSGLIVNLRASSLQDCYKQFKGKGLFAQNFREYVVKKSVDSGVSRSLAKERDFFWERNNGLIITCSEKHLDGNMLKLEKFSIVNGCQTTSLLGKTETIDRDNDFPIVCKVISAGHDTDRVEKIAEASNSQKAIKIQDLKSNAHEQKRLHQEFLALSPRVDLRIKRGIKVQNVDMALDNKVLGQLILSCIYQEPGRARSNTSSIFENDEVYRKIFRRKNYSVRSYLGLIQLNNEYDAWLKEVGNDWGKQFPSITDSVELATIGAVVKNGKWVLLAATMAMLKATVNGLSEKELMDTIGENWNLPSPLLFEDRPDDWVELLRVQWRDLAEELMAQYNSALKKGDTNSVSNFTKRDDVYRKNILGGMLGVSLFGTKRRVEDAKEFLEAIFNQTKR